MPDSTLRVGGFVPFTSIDYPGELAAVVFCQGCPWRCDYCHNPHLLPGSSEQLLDWEETLAELKQRSAFLDAVVFSGGEPTAQRALYKAMRQVKALDFKVGLHTAGAYPKRLQRLLPLLDWVGLDIKDLPDHYPDLTGVPGSGMRAWQSLELLRASSIPFQVRTTLGPDLPATRLQTLRARLDTAGVKDHLLQQCHPLTA
ncbi:anaerobic ribonucleoside-triphosphate reductase activating protein [Thiolapillus sp.]